MKTIDTFNWQEIVCSLDSEGWVVLGELLTPAECRAAAYLYDRDDSFRSKVVMARHGFGRGEYKYFAYPLPPRVGELRDALPASRAHRQSLERGAEE